MKKRITISIVTCLIAVFMSSCSCSSKQNCKTAKGLMEASIAAINSEEKKEFISLIDFDIVLEIFKKTAGDNIENKELVEMLKNDRKKFIGMYSIGYNTLIRTLEIVHKFDDIDFELIDFKLDKVEKEFGCITERYIMMLEDNKNNRWSMKINISKYNDCYYIMEPLNVNYLSKGW